ncbi:MAG: response regulator [Promethearchaeota archaeon]
MEKNKFKILLLDDQKSIRLTLQRALEKEGFLVRTSSNNNSARSILKKDKFDFIILDILLKDSIGFDVISKNRDLIDSETSIIFITGQPTYDFVLKAIELGADGFLAKPFSKTDLLNLIAKIKNRKDNLTVKARLNLFKTITSNIKNLEEKINNLKDSVETRIAEITNITENEKAREKLMKLLDETNAKINSLGEIIQEIYNIDPNSN